MKAKALGVGKSKPHGSCTLYSVLCTLILQTRIGAMGALIHDGPTR